MKLFPGGITALVFELDIVDLANRESSHSPGIALVSS